MRLTTGITKAYSIFISRKVTIALIALLGFFYFLGLVIPQKKLLQDSRYAIWQSDWPLLSRVDAALGLSSIYSSPLVISVTVLFFLNLLIVTCKRFPLVAKATRVPESVAITPESLLPLAHIDLDAGSCGGLEGCAEHVRTQGYTVVHGSGCFKGIKNRFSAIGSLFFHLSFLFILAGGAAIFHTYFRGEIRVVEGTSFYGRISDYLTATRLSSVRTWFPDLMFTLVSIKPQFIDLKPVAIPVNVIVSDTLATAGTRREGVLDVNRPLVFGSSYILITDGGAAPFFTVVAPSGKTVLADYLPLNILKGETDRFVVPGTDIEVLVTFWPDYYVDTDGYIVNRSFAFNRPLFELKMLRNGRQIGAGRLEKPDDAVMFDGYRLTRGDIRYYGRFVITDERGGGLLMTGFLLLITGLLTRFLFPRKEIMAVCVPESSGSVIRFGYRVEYYTDLAASQLEAITAQIAGRQAGRREELPGESRL